MKDGGKPSGTGLIRALVDHDRTVTITTSETQLGSSEIAVDKGNELNGVGSDSEVVLADNNGRALIRDSDGNISAEPIPKDIALGHELSHSLATMDGVSKHLGQTYRNYFTNRHGEEQSEVQPIEELYTTGVPGFFRPASSKRNVYPTENSLRAERNLGTRISYGNGRLLPRNKK